MASVNLYKSNYNGKQKTFQCVDIDLTDLQQGDIGEVYNTPGTFTATGDPVHILKFSIPTQGMNRVSGYVNDVNSAQNICKRPQYETIVGEDQGGEYYLINVLPDREEVPMGEAPPEDWDARYMDTYYYDTQNDWQSGNYYVRRMAPATANWDSNTQYYKDTETQILYFTGSLGVFGVSRYFYPVYAPNSTQFREVIGIGLPFAISNISGISNQNYCWKSGGYFGDLIAPSTMPTYKTIITANTVSINNVAGKHYSSIKQLVQMCQFKYTVQDSSHDGEPYEDTFTGVIVINLDAHDIANSAQVVAMSSVFWIDDKPPTRGEISHKQGGNGAHYAPSDDRGDRTGSTARGISQAWGSAATKVMGGFNSYYINNFYAGVFAEMTHSLWNPDTWQGFKNLMYDPISSVIVCHQLPDKLISEAVPSLANTSPIYAATVQLTQVSVPLISSWNSSYHIQKSFDILEQNGDFSDYSGTAVFIHLPYIGTKQIDTLAVMGGWISVDYLTDLFSGDCTAFVTVADRDEHTQIRYEWKGHCGKDIPLTQRVPISTQVAAAVGSAAITIGTQAVGGAIAGAVSNAIIGGMGLTGKQQQALRVNQSSTLARTIGTNVMSGATSLATSAASAVLSGQQTTTSNASGGGVSSPSDTACYLIIAIPQESDPLYYGEQKGYPCDISGTINGEKLTGFFQTQTIDVSTIANATDEEKYEIQQRLGAGVYVSNITY